MSKKIARLFVYLVPITVMFYFCQEYILSTYFNQIEFKITTFSIYLFHFLTVAVSYTLLVLVNKYFFQQTGFAFLAFGIIKMGLSVFFLMPVIDSDVANKIPDVFVFFYTVFYFFIVRNYFFG
jgi:hypothetical protein